MEQRIVVGYDGTARTRTALARAVQLDGQLIVATAAVSDATAVAPALCGYVTCRIPSIEPEALLDFAIEANATCVVLPQLARDAGRIFRHALVYAADRTRAGHPAVQVLMVQPGETDPSPYNSMLVGTDGAVGSGLAAVVAAQVAEAHEASLDVLCVERRSNEDLRTYIDDELERDPEFDVDSFRGEANEQVSELDRARDEIQSAGVPVSFSFEEGEPGKVLADAARAGNYDLLVTSTIGVRLRGRQGEVGRLTRELLRRVDCDHLLVFDAVSLGLSPVARAAVVSGAALLLLGGTAFAASGGGQAEAGVPAFDATSAHVSGADAAEAGAADAAAGGAGSSTGFFGAAVGEEAVEASVDDGAASNGQDPVGAEFETATGSSNGTEAAGAEVATSGVDNRAELEAAYAQARSSRDALIIEANQLLKEAASLYGIDPAAAADLEAQAVSRYQQSLEANALVESIREQIRFVYAERGEVAPDLVDYPADFVGPVQVADDESDLHADAIDPDASEASGVEDLPESAEPDDVEVESSDAGPAEVGADSGTSAPADVAEAMTTQEPELAS